MNNTPPTPLLKIYLFGSFEVLLGGKNIQNKLWQSRQVRSVFKALIARRGVVTTSEQLIEMLWPGDDPEIALRRLYVRVSQLRKLLRTDADINPIQRVPGGYLFMQDVYDTHLANGDQRERRIWVDVDEFERAAEQGRQWLDQKHLEKAVLAFEQARQLHRGDYLAEDPYAEWTIAERERLNETYLVMLTELAEAYAQQGYFRRSINLCQQILCLDPWREAVFVHLMLYYYYAGDKAKALQTYAQCQRALNVHIGIEPDPHTTWFAQCIREGTLWSKPGEAAYPPPAYEGRIFEVPYSLGEPPFVGRDRELAWLLDHWRRNPQGCTWISGEAGIGKTRLANAFIHLVKAEGAAVVRLTAPSAPGGFYEALLAALNIPEALSTITDLSPRSRAILSQLVNDDSDIQVGTDLRGNERGYVKNISAAVLELMLLKYQQLLICVDDAHLLDEVSIEIIQDMIGRVGLLMSSRLGEGYPNDPFLRLTQGHEISIRARVLNPWGLDDVRQLLQNLGGGEVLNIAEDLYNRSEGNPLFIIASLQHLFEEGLLYVTPNGNWAQSGPFEGAIAPSIERAIAQRLNLVQQDDRMILDVLAVAGGETDYEILQAVLERDESALLASVDQLISKALVIEPRDYQSSDLTLAHGLYSEVLYETLPKARQRIFHRRIAEAMLSTGRDAAFQAGCIAGHFFRGGEAEQGSHYARMAGDHALRMYAPREAIQYFLNALRWVEPLAFTDKPNFVAQVWLGMAEAERFLGHYTQASEYYQRSLPFLRGAYKEVAIFQMFNIQILQGKPLSAYADLTAEYEHLLTKDGHSSALALFFWSKSFVALLQGDAKETRRQQVNGWRVARHLCAQGKQPPPWILQRAYSILMRAHNQWGNYVTSIHFAKRVLSVGSRSEMNPNTQAVVSASLGDSYTFLGKFTQAEEAWRQCYDLAQAAGDPRLLAVGLLGLGNVSLLRGDFEQAEDYSQQVLTMSDPKADILRQMLAQYLMVSIATKTRVDQEHIASLENILTFTRYIDARPHSTTVLLTLGEMALLLNDLQQAEACVQEALQLANQCHLKREACSALRFLAEVRTRQEDLDSALYLVKDALALAQRIQAPYEIGLSTRARANAQPDTRRAMDDGSRALSIFEELGAAYEAQQTRILLANWDAIGSRGETDVRET